MYIYIIDISLYVCVLVVNTLCVICMCICMSMVFTTPYIMYTIIHLQYSLDVRMYVMCVNGVRT